MKKNRSNRDAGFTLFEVVITLAIASLALTMLLAAISTGVGNTALAHQFVEATRRAQVHLAQIGVSETLTPGTRGGNDGGGFVWSERVTQAGRHASSDDSGDQKVMSLYDVTVQISWRSGDRTRSVTLQSQRLARE